MPLAVFFVLFAGLWTAVSFFIAWQSGWRDLAGRYRAAGVPDGERRRWVSAGLDGVSFRSSLNVVAGPAGLHLSPVLMFRPFMPPLLIPWTDIRFLGASAPLGIRRFNFRLGAAEGPELCAGPALAAAIGPRLPEPQKTLYEDALVGLPRASFGTAAAASLATGAAASGLFYALAGRGPHAAPLPVILLPSILIPALLLARER